MSSASSRAGSIVSVHPELDEHTPSRLYNIYKKPFHRNYEVKSAADQILFYGEVSSFTRHKPDLTLHRGTSAHAPVVAACKFVSFARDFKLALGDPDDELNTKWEDMTKESKLNSKYRFEVTVPNQQSESQGERRSFLWKRTRHVGINDSKPRWSPNNFKLVDECTEEVVAVFTSGKSFHKCGKLQIKAGGYGENFDMVILLSYLGLYEARKRRENRSAAAGGGAGG
ncbi:uncharacterized protein N7459_005125 [Penicillium hispanicum]|uniref:uncharacterized protein n=1 Tax=Penicillium hispanicum TaxID=1080232 RepID=UPI0025415D3A|nr:uncharacterized protein N7459_005125 [Penicillium hispanicum]KAJ5585325.1 hypothetical protein N7459_005125 [Penicillium hispanicum]